MSNDKRANHSYNFIDFPDYSQIITVYKTVRKSVNVDPSAKHNKSTLMCLMSPYVNGRYGAVWSVPAYYVPDKFLIKYTKIISGAFSGFVYCGSYKLAREELAKRGVLIEDKERNNNKKRKRVKEEKTNHHDHGPLDVNPFGGFRDLLDAPYEPYGSKTILPETWSEFSNAKRKGTKEEKTPFFHSEIGFDGVNQLCESEENMKGADNWLNVLLSKRINFNEDDIILYAAKNAKHIFSEDLPGRVNSMKKLIKMIQHEIEKEKSKQNEVK